MYKLLPVISQMILTINEAITLLLIRFRIIQSIVIEDADTNIDIKGTFISLLKILIASYIIITLFEVLLYISPVLAILVGCYIIYLYINKRQIKHKHPIT